MDNLVLFKSQKPTRFLALCFVVLAIGANVSACNNTITPGPLSPPAIPTSRATQAVTAAPANKAQPLLIPAHTPEPSHTQVAQAQLLLEPTPTWPPSHTPTPSPTHSPYLIQDSTNTITAANFLWHPDNSRGTQRLDLSIGPNSWSPDGRQLVGWSQEQQTLVIVTLETGEHTPLANVSPSVHGLNWSPDGRYLLYLVDIPSDGGTWSSLLVLYDLAAQREHVLGEPLDPIRWIALIGWSSDSRYVAHTYWMDGADGGLVTVLEILDIRTGIATRYAGNASTAFFTGSWSPANNRILLLGGENASPGMPFGQILEPGGFETIFLYDVADRSMMELLGPSYYFVNHSPWSVDGERVIYSERGTICQLEVDTGANTCSNEIANAIGRPGIVGGFFPSWSPTGEWIGFLLQQESVHCSPIAAIRPDGKDLRVTDAESGDCAAYGPTWSPRHRE